MVYLDTSSLLKLIWLEEESEAVGDRISREEAVLVSSLSELESSIQITAAHLRGNYSLARSRRLLKELDSLLDSEPFERRALSGEVFKLARLQHSRSGITGFCRTLDRLHLAAMQEFGQNRLITNDMQQAEAARALGFVAEIPGSS
jgi:predicted nucleic acid-binding protein